MSIPNQIITAQMAANRALDCFKDCLDFPGPFQWEDTDGWHATKGGKAFPKLGAIGRGGTREEAMEDLERIWPAKVREAKLNELRSEIGDLEYELADKPAELERLKAKLARMEAGFE